MKVKEAKRKENTVSLKVDVDPQEVEAKIQPAFKKISKNKVVPGFRKGKANFESFIKYYVFKTQARTNRLFANRLFEI